MARSGPLTPQLTIEDLEVCKQIIVVQSRRTWESQNRIGLSEDQSELYLDLYFKLAQEHGQQLPSRQELVKDPHVIRLFSILSQNSRATFASADHHILAEKEREFLEPLGLRIAVTDRAASEFVIGSHGVTAMETTTGKDTWLPIAPDVAISLFGSPGTINIGIYPPEFVEQHNGAALSTSTQVAGLSREKIIELLGTVD